MRTLATIPLAVSLMILAPGCVERTIKITTEPTGAAVYLNDELVGRTPAEVRFQWYGDYDIAVRKEGFDTLRTHKRIHPPVYQWPVLDVISELLVPVTFYDRHAWHFELDPQTPPQPEELLERALELRAAVSGEPLPLPAEADRGAADVAPGAPVEAAPAPADEPAPAEQ